ncbi:GGDEF domain-containing protein [Acidaminobacter sp. JC074]|uniref:bifunctional diguanylate cyclase/phosphodiesterase n=1 Tax=Acidaminobacter sp. JC074 TaxID=2530199 RepID=UPI001F10596C|nr:bifunctional diguanylate cyclase/phosphodiesterase [Acidaminobacter sp. JC074]MCH4889308.1 GGDEF domain-containing protein [Acidaminobacter sp. JC074]
MELEGKYLYKNLYDYDMIKKMDPFINKLLLIGGVISLIGGLYVLYFSESLLVFAIIDFFIACLSIVMFLYRKSIKTIIKLISVVFVLLIYGIYAFQYQGIYGTGIYMILTSIVLSSVFLNIRVGICISVICSFHGFYILSKIISRDLVYLENLTKSNQIVVSYVLVYFGIAIVSIAMFVALDAIKKHLYDNIGALNTQMTKLETTNKELVEKNKEIEYLAYYNKLTNLPNIAYFRNVVDEYLIGDAHGTFGLIDCKEFYKFNAFYGMDKGDELLAYLGDWLKKLVLGKYIVGYFGNNTIGVWINTEVDSASFEDSYQVNLKLLQESLPFNFNLDAYVVGVTRSNKMNTFDDIYNVAVKAMKMLKREKGHQYVFIDSDYYKALSDHNIIESYIKDSIDKSKFEIYYQEKVDITRNRVVGLEALSRLKKDNYFLSPNMFIPIIEENNWSMDFGQRTIERVFKDIPEILKIYGNDLLVSINVSPQQISHPSFIETLERSIEEYDVEAKFIELEITENILLMDIERSISILNAVKDMGFIISIDDFGTGYSSMKYITELPLDVIKIDKSFVGKLSSCNKTKAIVKSIIDISKALNISIVAEGVEYEHQVDVLKELGCPIAQGYYFSVPKPMRAFDKDRRSNAE